MDNKFFDKDKVRGWVERLKTLKEKFKKIKNDENLLIEAESSTNTMKDTTKDTTEQSKLKKLKDLSIKAIVMTMLSLTWFLSSCANQPCEDLELQNYVYAELNDYGIKNNVEDEISISNIKSHSVFGQNDYYAFNEDSSVIRINDGKFYIFDIGEKQITKRTLNICSGVIDGVQTEYVVIEQNKESEKVLSMLQTGETKLMVCRKVKKTKANADADEYESIAEPEVVVLRGIAKETAEMIINKDGLPLVNKLEEDNERGK